MCMMAIVQHAKAAAPSKCSKSVLLPQLHPARARTRQSHIARGCTPLLLETGCAEKQNCAYTCNVQMLWCTLSVIITVRSRSVVRSTLIVAITEWPL